MHPQILNIRPAPGGAGGRTVAFVDVQLTSDCRLFNLRLVDTPEGWRIRSPMAFGTSTATFAPELARAITAVAIKSLGDNFQHDRHPAAA